LIQNNTIKIALFYLISISFILLNLWLVIKKDTLAGFALPFLLGLLLLAVFSFDKLIYLTVFFAPLSQELSRLMPWLSFNMYLPTEPILFGILLLFFIKVLQERQFNREIILHPVSIAIYINLFWILVTSFTSSMPVVSFKYLLVRIWFVVAFYLLTAKIFSDGKKQEQYVWLYLSSFLIVILYAISRHWGYGLLNKQAAHYVVVPFYNDHTSYGAALAIYLPFVTLFSFGRAYSKKIRRYSMIVLGILVTAFILSYSRAAWVSMIIAILVWGVIRLRIRFKHIALVATAFLFFTYSFQDEIVGYLERNSDESSSNLLEHFSSITNISSDASNLERLNRWNCATKMFKERPFWGYGPGTYMFQYAKYQLKKDRTIISTNAGDGGNAHSEYLGPLAESGVLGLITFLILIVTVIYTGIHARIRTSDKRLKGILMAAIVGLITYYIHGFLNNFLDTDKLSVPFWGFTAMIVAIDLYSRKEKQTADKNPA